jgi:hypothetical protein
MKKLIQLSLVVRTNPVLRDCTVDIIKDSWWTLFLVANMWVAWMRAVQEQHMVSNSDSDDDESVDDILQRCARKLKAPDPNTAEHDYILSAFRLLRTTQLRHEVPGSSPVVQMVWAEVWLPLCVNFAKAIMGAGLGSKQGSTDIARRHSEPANIKLSREIEKFHKSESGVHFSNQSSSPLWLSGISGIVHARKCISPSPDCRLDSNS